LQAKAKKAEAKALLKGLNPGWSIEKVKLELKRRGLRVLVSTRAST
jgi:hypothetical protein